MIQFFSFDARVRRRRWIGSVLLALPLLVGGVLMLRTGIPAAVIAAGTLGGAVTAKLLTEAVRRRHDMDKSGGAAILLFAGGMAALSLAFAYALLSGISLVFYAVLLLLGLCSTALLLRSGGKEGNGYGPPPLQPLIPAFGGRRGSSGVAAAIVLILLGTGIGYAGSRWIEGLRARHAFEQRQSESVHASGNNAAPTELEDIYHGRNEQ